MWRWGEKLAEIQGALRDVLHVLGTLGGGLRRIEEEQRALRSTLDQLLLAQRERPAGPGIASMLREEAEEEVDPEQRKRDEEDWAALRKAWGQLYGPEVSDG